MALTPEALFALCPGPEMLAASYDPDSEAGPVDWIGMREVAIEALAAQTRVAGDSVTALAVTNGAVTDTTQVELSLAAGKAMVGGVLGTIAALASQPVLGTDEWAKSIALDGSAAAVPTADGQTSRAALVVVLISGALDLRLVVGDEAANGAEVAPDGDAIYDALVAEGAAGLDPTVALVIGRFTMERGAGTTLTVTQVDPATDDALANERARASVRRPTALGT